MENIANECLLIELHTKFSDNIMKSLEDENKHQALEFRAKQFALLGQIIKEDTLDTTHLELYPIFDEVSSDCILSLYLASCSLDKPAQIILRRALELGIALVYLWDLPCTFWGWKSHDVDLNFNEMINYLTHDSYNTYIKSINPNLGNALFNSTDARVLYRELSNTTHGKITTFETNLPHRFSYNTTDWKSHLNDVRRVEDIIHDIWWTRFSEYIPEFRSRTQQLI